MAIPIEPPAGWAARLERAIEILCKALIVVSGLGLVAMLTATVVLRYLFESGLNSSVELTELLFSIFVMAGIVLAARHGAHVATQLTLAALQGRARRTLGLAIALLTAATYLLLAWYALLNARIAHDQHTPVLGIPFSVGYGCLALGLLLVALCGVTTACRIAAGQDPLQRAQLDGAEHAS